MIGIMIIVNRSSKQESSGNGLYSSLDESATFDLENNHNGGKRKDNKTWKKGNMILLLGFLLLHLFYLINAILEQHSLRQKQQASVSPLGQRQIQNMSQS